MTPKDEEEPHIELTARDWGDLSHWLDQQPLAPDLGGFLQGWGKRGWHQRQHVRGI